MNRPSYTRLSAALLMGLALTQLANAQTVRYTIDPMLPAGAPPNSMTFTEAIQGAGDVDGDGYDDFLISINTDSEVGGVYSGRTGAVVFNIPAVPNASTGLRRDSRSLARAGDMDGDGKDDIVISHDGTSQLAHGWQVDVLSGTTGTLIRSFAHGPFHDQATRVQTLGDVNGDGTPDLLMQQYNYGLEVLLHIFIVSGADGVEIARLDSSAIPPTVIGVDIRVRTIGDLNGDSVREVLVGNRYYDGTMLGWVGQVRVFSGVNLALIHSVNGSAHQELGHSVGDAGDVNGDGVGDFFASGLGTGAGFTEGIRLFSGVDGSPLGQFEWTVPSNTTTILAEGVGDMNGDGLHEIAVRVPDASGGAHSIHVYTAATGVELFAMSAPLAGLRFGETLAAVGDANGDGMQDLVIGAPQRLHWQDSPVHAKAYVVSHAPVNGGTLCVGLVNSTGKRARLTATSPSGFTLAGNDVTLNAVQMPPNNLGLPIVSRFAGMVIRPGGIHGRLCIWGNPVGRSNSLAFMSSATGTATIPVDAQAIDFGGAPISALVGDTFNFQFWFRDVAGGTATANFTDAVTITYQ